MWLLNDSFIGYLEKRLAQELPGEEAQYKMAPLGRKTQVQIKYDRIKAKQSAVSIILFEENELAIPLILRQKYKGVHSNQVSLPGGKQEAHENLYETSLRETEEELGISPDKLELIGKLSPLYIPPSNFWVQPFVYFSSKQMNFIPEEKEVKEIFTFPVSKLLDSGTKSVQEVRTSQGFNTNTPGYSHNNKYIWGATAMILSELEHIILDYQQL